MTNFIVVCSDSSNNSDLLSKESSVTHLLTGHNEDIEICIKEYMHCNTIENSDF
jgi:hypothetical protein